MRKTCPNGMEIFDEFILMRVKGVIKGHQYVLRKKVRVSYNDKTWKYEKPDNTKEAAFKEMAKTQ